MAQYEANSSFRGPHEAWLVRLCYGRALSTIHHVCSDGLRRDRLSGWQIGDDETRRAARETLIYSSVGARGVLGLLPLLMFIVTTVANLWRFGIGVIALTFLLTIALGGLTGVVRLAGLRMVPDRYGPLLEPWNWDLAWQTIVTGTGLVLLHAKVGWP